MKRGLANANKETRERVARMGGLSEHPNGRGLANCKDAELKFKIAQSGARARYNKNKEQKEAV